MQTLLPSESESIREGVALLRAFAAFLVDPKHSLGARVALLEHAGQQLAVGRSHLHAEHVAPVQSRRAH